MKAVVAAFNQEKALVGAFSVLRNLRMELFKHYLMLLQSGAKLRWCLSFCESLKTVPRIGDGCMRWRYFHIISQPRCDHLPIFIGRHSAPQPQLADPAAQPQPTAPTGDNYHIKLKLNRRGLWLSQRNFAKAFTIFGEFPYKQLGHFSTHKHLLWQQFRNTVNPSGIEMPFNIKFKFYYNIAEKHPKFSEYCEGFAKLCWQLYQQVIIIILKSS